MKYVPDSTSYQVLPSRCGETIEQLMEDTSTSVTAEGRAKLNAAVADRLFRSSAALLSIVMATSATISMASWLTGLFDPRPAACLSVAMGPLLIGAFSWGRGLGYTMWIVAAVAVPLMYPQPFVRIGGFELASLIVPVIMFIMFAMGTQMSLSDFRGVVQMPRGVVVGLVGQFTIMPLLGGALARLPGLTPELAAGVILIGSCSSGLASSVMAYLAKANLALSITLTAVGTALAPLITPFWMKLLVDATVPINAGEMMFDIVKLTILPVTAGLLFNRYLIGRWRFVDSAMPVLAMSGIVYYTLVSTALGRESLLRVGIVLVLAAIVHNLGGYVLGYWLARLARLDEQSCRTVALEVGMQNGGMAVGLAKEMNRVATVGLAAIVFSPWMNISGSLLANYWRRRPVYESSYANLPSGIVH